MNNKTILALVFLMAGTLLTIGATTIVPAAYAEEDDHDDYNGDRNKNHDDYNGDGNKNSAEEGSAAAIADCDDNEVDNSDFDCFAIPVNGIELG